MLPSRSNCAAAYNAVGQPNATITNAVGRIARAGRRRAATQASVAPLDGSPARVHAASVRRSSRATNRPTPMDASVCVAMTANTRSEGPTPASR